MIRTKYMIRTSLVLVLLAFPTLRLQAQAVYGSISGTIFDSSGAAVPNAKIVITDVGRDVSYTTSANESGNYSQTHLIIGRYRVRVDTAGFKASVQDNVKVEVDTRTTVDLPL